MAPTERMANTLREMIFTMYCVLEEGVFDDGAQTENIGRETIGRANATLRALGYPEVTEEDWRRERDES